MPDQHNVPRGPAVPSGPRYSASAMLTVGASDASGNAPVVFSFQIVDQGQPMVALPGPSYFSMPLSPPEALAFMRETLRVLDFAMGKIGHPGVSVDVDSFNYDGLDYRAMCLFESFVVSAQARLLQLQKKYAQVKNWIMPHADDAGDAWRAAVASVTPPLAPKSGS